MYCSNCGKENPENAKFCHNCGIDMTGQTSYKPVERSSIVPQLLQEKKFDLSQLSALTLIYCVGLGLLSIIGSFGIAIIGIIIWYFLAGHAINTMTYKVKGSVNWAFAIIFTFGIIGYFCYWIWFLNKRNAMQENP
jgi:uncharacterized membrane protein YvbJ